MFKTYMKMAWRNLIKNKVSSFINIAGLAVAVGCCLVAFLIVDFHYNKDTFHENAEQIFLVENVIEVNGKRQIWGDSPMPLGPALKADFPQIISAVRLTYGKATVKYDDKVFGERIQFVDDEFLDMFTFPLKYGTPDALADENGLVFSEELATKYFGDTDPVGQQVSIKIGDNPKKSSFVVKGVAEKLPDSASFGFSILMNYEKQRALGIIDLNDWKNLTRATFIQLQNPDDISVIEAQSQRYVNVQNSANPDRPMASFVYEPLLSMGQNAYKIRKDITRIELHPGQIVSSFFTGLFLLSLACFNFMNIATVSATRRLKEIGIRKVVGSHKFHLVKQILGENLLLCLIALVIGVALGELFIVPGFNNLYGVFNLEIDLFSNTRLWAFFIALLVVTGIGAGAYPAFYISSFQPADILRGKRKLGGNKRFTKSLLIFQFVIAFVALVEGMVFIQNNEYQRNRDWGYNEEHVIVVPVNDEGQFTLIQNAISEHPNVLGTAGSKHHLHVSSSRAGIEILDKNYEIAKLDIGFDYFETMELRLKEGRAFNREFSRDGKEAIMVNETMVKELGWQNPVGKQINYENAEYTVIGVVEDFHFQSFGDKVEPFMLRVVDKNEFKYLSIAFSPGTGNQTNEYLKETWRTLIPDSPYNGFYHDSIFEGYNEAMAGNARGGTFIASVALLITCMGVFGLVSLNIAKRMKEISIRKVLGASIFNVAKVINNEFIVLLTVAIVIAVPVSYWALNLLLDSLWSDHSGVGFVTIAAAFGVIVFSTLLTISSQLYKAVLANPVETLRYE